MQPQDLSHEIAAIACYFDIHGFTWSHPRVLAYLDRCGAPTKHHLSPKELKNLLKQLENLPIPSCETLKVG